MILYDHEKKVLCLYDNQKEWCEVTLRPKERGIWELLIANTDKAVSRNMMCEKVWGGRYVTDYTINQTINQLRKKIEDNNKSIIITVPKHGYLIDSSFIRFKKYDTQHDLDIYDKENDSVVYSDQTQEREGLLKRASFLLNNVKINKKIRKFLSFFFSFKTLVLITIIFSLLWFDRKEIGAYFIS